MTVRSVLGYALPRVLILVVVTWLLTLLGAHWMLAVVIASLIAMLISIVVLQRPRQAVADKLEAGEGKRRSRREERQHRRAIVDGPSDEEIEDAAIDDAAADAQDTDSPTSSRTE